MSAGPPRAPRRQPHRQPTPALVGSMPLMPRRPHRLSPGRGVGSRGSPLNWSKGGGCPWGCVRSGRCILNRGVTYISFFQQLTFHSGLMKPNIDCGLVDTGFGVWRVQCICHCGETISSPTGHSTADQSSAPACSGIFVPARPMLSVDNPPQERGFREIPFLESHPKCTPKQGSTPLLVRLFPPLGFAARRIHQRNGFPAPVGRRPGGGGRGVVIPPLAGLRSAPPPFIASSSADHSPPLSSPVAGLLAPSGPTGPLEATSPDTPFLSPP